MGASNSASQNTCAKAAPPVPLNDRLTWRIADVAQALGVARRTLERLRSAGQFPPPDLHIGKAPLWKPETIRAWVEQGGDA